MKTKCKSLGKMEYPEFSINYFLGYKNHVEISITTRNKKVVVQKTATGAVTSLVKLAQEITGRYRNYALGEWQLYLQMKKQSGYVPPNGEQ